MSTSHLTSPTIEALQLPLDQRIDYCYNKRWVPYPDAVDILDQLEQGFKRQRSDRPTNFAIIAPSNNGKSTLLRKFASMHPVRLVNAESGEMAPCVLRLELPSSPTESAVCSAILHELNIHHAERDPPMKRYMQVLRALEHANVRMLLLDEFNHIANAHGKSSQVLALIKNLCTKGQITIIAAGIETVRNILRSEEQINNRFVTLQLKRWDMTPDYRKLLAAYETVLPLAEPSNLAGRELLPTIYSMAGDTIGATVRLVTEAAAYAIRKGYERIDAKVLKDMPFKREGA